MATMGQKYGISGSRNGWTFTGNVRGNILTGRGQAWYVDTTISASGDGKSWATPFKTMAEAQAARAKIQSGTSYEDLAAQRGLKPEQISLGTLAQSDLPDAERAKPAQPARDAAT